MATEAPAATRAEQAVARVNNVLEKVDAGNRMLPPDRQIQMALPQMEATATLDALIRLLIDAGIIEEQAFLDTKYERLAELAEQAYGQVQELKRETVRQMIVER